VIGSPYETRDDIMETLRFIQRNKIDTFKTFVLTPLPATPMWEYARGRGMVSDDMDWGRLDVNFDDNHEKAIVLSETLSKDELHELYLLFEREREKKYKSSLLKAGLKKPHKIPAFLLRKVLK
jgi:radical SAM superfamily enzyme